MSINWLETTLEDACLLVTDGAHNSPKSVDVGLPMASVKDLTPYGITIETCRLISEDDFQKLVKWGSKPQKGDVLIAKDGATALDTVCEIKDDINVVLLSSVAILRPNPDIVIPTYLRYYLDSPSTRSYMKGSFITGAAIPRVVLKDFKRVKIHIPSIDVQRRIANILSTYDDLIENNTRRIRILEQMAQAIYQEWFGKVDRESLPKGWRLVNLSEIADVNSTNIKIGSEPKEINYVDIASVSTGKIDAIQQMKFSIAPGRARRIVKHGDVIWSTVRPNRKSYSLVINPPENMIVSTGFAVLRAKSVPFSYLYLATTTDDFAGYLTNHATGSAYPAVSSSDFENAEIVLPTKDLLNKFDEITSQMFVLRENLINKNNNLRQTRDLLLPRLINGEIEVSELTNI